MTSPPSEARQEALAAAAEIVAAFGAHDPQRYFSLFDEAATFLFHASDRLFTSRAEYEAEWANWEADGFRVLGCTSFDGRADEIAEGVVVFTHRAHTRVHDDEGDHDQHERETIVLRRSPDGSWLGVHEHLSPFELTPEPAAP